MTTSSRGGPTGRPLARSAPVVGIPTAGSAPPVDGALADDLTAEDLEPTGTFTRYTEVSTCPRCKSETHYREECPVCALPITDELIEATEATERRVNARRLIVAGVLAICTFIQIEGIAVGYAMGRRSTTVETRTAERATEDETRRIFRSMDRVTRLRHQAAQLQNLFNAELLPAYKIKFTRRAISKQPPPPATDSMNVDVTFVTSSDAEWRKLTREDRELLVAGLAQSHARFLALAGAADTSRFAAVISVYDPGVTDTDKERILAVRDRAGHIFLR